jgi:hypothetical protein
MRHESDVVLFGATSALEDDGMNGGSSGLSEKYEVSPLAAHDRALETARALLLLEVAREAINFELRRQHGFTAEYAAEIIRQAATLVPRSTRVTQPARRRTR